MFFIPWQEDSGCKPCEDSIFTRHFRPVHNLDPWAGTARAARPGLLGPSAWLDSPQLGFDMALSLVLLHLISLNSRKRPLTVVNYKVTRRYSIASMFPCNGGS